MLLLLIFILSSVAFIHYRITKDILRPGIGIVISFILATISAYYNQNFWGNDISIDTFMIICSAVIIYVLVDLLSFSYTGEKIRSVELVDEDRKTIKINELKYLATLLIMAVSSVIYYREIIRLVNSNGIYGDWNASISYYRNSGVTGTLEEGVSGLASNLYLLSTAISYVFMYIFIHNIIVTQGRKRNPSNYFNLIPVLLYLVNTVLTGGRLPILRLLIGGIFIYLFLLVKSTAKNISIKSIGKISTLVVLSLWGFSLLSGVVGRSTIYSPIYYVTSYIGGGIILFDLFIENPIHHTVFGYETFPSILKTLGNWFDKSDWQGILVNKEFRVSKTGESLGNVYTALRAYIADFGYLGMILLVVLHAFIFVGAYYTLKKHRVKWGEIDMSILLYMFVAHVIYLFSIDDRFYMDILSIGTVKIIFLIFLVKYFYTGIQFKNGKLVIEKIVNRRR